MLSLDDFDDYQHRAADELYRRDACLAIMPMGSGKTVTALTAAQDLVRDGVVDRWLVLGPKRVVQITWPNEQSKWAHFQDLDIETVVGKKPADRWAGAPTFLCVNFQLIDQIPEAMFAGARWGCIIDETTKLKASGGEWNNAWRRLKKHFQIVWGLTGTPKPNRYLELFGQVKAVAGPSLWGGSFDKWKKKYFYPTDYHNLNWELRPEYKETIVRDINKIGFRVDEAELPPRPEHRDIDIVVEPSADAKKLYRQIAKEGLVTYCNKDVEAASAAIVVAKQCQLAQGFIYATDEDEDERHTLHVDNAKINALRDLVDGLQDQPLLIFYQFQEDLRRMLNLWPAMPYLGQGCSDRQAMEAERRWNRGELPLMALHPASGGHGLNLQHGGRHCVWYGLPFSNELYRQAIKRLDRRGQPGQVINYRLISRETHDPRIAYEVLAGREMSQQEFIQEVIAA